jgi:hypothetical protein
MASPNFNGPSLPLVNSGQKKADASATLGSFIANHVWFDKRLYSAEMPACSEEPMVSFYSSSVPWSLSSSDSQSARTIPQKDPWDIQKKRNFSENPTSDFWACSPYFWVCWSYFWPLSFLFQMTPPNFWIAKFSVDSVQGITIGKGRESPLRAGNWKLRTDWSVSIEKNWKYAGKSH